MRASCVPHPRLWSALTRVSGPVAALVSVAFSGLALLGAVRHRLVPGATVVEERAFGPSYTWLAERVKGKLAAWVVRDAPYLMARYGPRMGAYRLLACRRQSRLLGYCIVKLRRFQNETCVGSWNAPGPSVVGTAISALPPGFSTLQS